MMSAPGHRKSVACHVGRHGACDGTLQVRSLAAPLQETVPCRCQCHPRPYAAPPSPELPARSMPPQPAPVPPAWATAPTQPLAGAPEPAGTSAGVSDPNRCAYCAPLVLVSLLPPATRVMFGYFEVAAWSGPGTGRLESRVLCLCLDCWHRLRAARSLVEKGWRTDWPGGIRHDLKALAPPVRGEDGGHGGGAQPGGAIDDYWWRR